MAMKNRIFSKFRQAFTMTNNMALSMLLENVILINIILTTGATHWIHDVAPGTKLFST